MVSRARRVVQQVYTVRDDWFAWLPNEMDQVFDATRRELESSNNILSITLGETLVLCEQGNYVLAMEHAAMFADFFERLANRLRLVVCTIRDHGSHFGTLPNVTPLVPGNFRGNTAQRISLMSSLLARVVFRARTRFFHKLQSLNEIIEELQEQVRKIAEECDCADPVFLRRAWPQLEVLGYDLNTCMGEVTVVLKSFFCVLPGEELEGFRAGLSAQASEPLVVHSGQTEPSQRK